eukprot:gene5992-12074_t
MFTANFCLLLIQYSLLLVSLVRGLESSINNQILEVLPNFLPPSGKTINFSSQSIYNVNVTSKDLEFGRTFDAQSDGTESDGDIRDRMNTFDIRFGTGDMSTPPYGTHYINEVQNKMQAIAVGGSWTSIGPTYTPYPELDSGRVRTILPHPTISATLYVLTSGGGLWKTTNFLDTIPAWTPLTDFLTTTSGGAAALGSNPNTIYFGMGDPYDRVGVGGLFTKSTDGGSTWSTPIDLSSFDSYTNRVTTVHFIAVDTSTGSDIIFVTTNMGIFRSTDGGETFTNPYSLAGKSKYANIGSLVKTGSGGSLWWIGYDYPNKALIVSTNQGSSWGALAGTNWATITSYDAGRTTFSVGVSGEATIYALVSEYSYLVQLDVLKSINGGVTWTSCQCNGYYAPTNPNSELQYNLNVVGGQGWYNHMILVDPSDSTRNTVYVGGQLVAVKTTNAGTAWTVISTWNRPSYFNLPYIHADFHAAAAFTTVASGVTTLHLIFGTDGGLAYSADKGETWSSNKNTGLVTQLPNFICGSPLLNRLMIGLQDQGTRERTDSNGTTWYFIYGGDGDGCGYSQAKNKVNIMSFYYSQFDCRYFSATTNTFGSVSACVSGISDFDKPFYTNLRTPSAAADPTGTIFFTVTHTAVYRSSMPSTTLEWTRIGYVGADGISAGNIRETFQPMGIGPTSTNQVAFAKDTEICITTNGGISWSTKTVSSSISGWSKGTSPVWASSTVLYLASEDTTIGVKRLAKSTNTGLSWTAPNTGTNKLPDIPIGSLLVSSTYTSGNTVFAGTWIGVYVTTDGGVNWNVLGSKLPNVVVSDMYQISNILYIAAYGRGVWQVSLTDEATSRMPSNVPVSVPASPPVIVPVSSPVIFVPGCNVLYPTWLGNHYCNDDYNGYNTAACNWDGGDCCAETCDVTLYSTCGTKYNPFVCRNPAFSSPSPSIKPSSSPINKKPTFKPSKHPTSKPTSQPSTTKDPTLNPSKQPSKKPTITPSKLPTKEPSKKPTSEPTKKPSTKPSKKPTIKPSKLPTKEPSKKPTSEPTKKPSTKPSKKPTFKPSKKPSRKPTL